MKLYERIENNNFDEIDRNRAIELIKNGNGHLVYNENYFKLQKENEELKFEERSRIIGKYGEVEIHDVINRTLSNDYIPKQKVKYKIEKEIKYHEKNILDIENTTMLKGKTAKEEAEIEFNKYAIVVLKKILQELIKEEEENHEENI